MEPSTKPQTITSEGPSKTLADLDEDSIAHCATFLDRRDVLNLALTCKNLRRVAYSDSVWSRLYRERWPWLSVNPGAHMREAYLARFAALQQFKFIDPVEIEFHVLGVPPSHILLNRDDIILSQIQEHKYSRNMGLQHGPAIGYDKYVKRRLQVLPKLGNGSSIQILKADISGLKSSAPETHRVHSARITCMRLFPLLHTSLCRSDAQTEDQVLVTSSADHTIRLWWKGRSLRCFKGHNNPVTTLGDRLLGDSSLKMFASGGEDGTVRLWPFSSSGKRNPVMTLYGHEKQISSLAVAGHNLSLLASISKDAKIRVWDTTATSSTRSSPCVGMTSVSGQPLDMKCHEALCYVGAGSSVTAIDLRTMQKTFAISIHPKKLCAFEVLPSKSLLCTGGMAKAMLWDIRNQRSMEPIADLEGHEGNVTMIHMDPYKIVTGGMQEHSVNVWEADTGTLTNSLPCFALHDEESDVGLTGLAVDGFRIATACSNRSSGQVHTCFWDFSYATAPRTSEECSSSSKFWKDLSAD